MSVTQDINIENKGPIPTNYGGLTTLVTVFFFWGFIASGNSVFIPFCKHYFSLDQFQSQLIDFAFYTAYYIGALGLFAYGAFGGHDLVGKWGYKKSIVYGLLFSAVGAAAMIIAVNANAFAGMLVGLFIVALGFSVQQTAAQPFASALGDPATGTSRITLGGAINSFGTTIGPLVIALALFGTAKAISDEEIAALGLSKVIILYCCVGALFIAAASLFHFSKKVPAGIIKEPTEKATKAFYGLLIMSGLLIIMFVPVFASYRSVEAKEVARLETVIGGYTKQIDSLGTVPSPTAATQIAQVTTLKNNTQTTHDDLKAPLERNRMYWLFGALCVVIIGLLSFNMSAKKDERGWGAMKYPQLVLGMLAIFLYVGVEVTVGSNLAELLKQTSFGGYKSSQVAPFISMYWGSLMIGRWAGSIAAFNFSSMTKKILTFVVPLVAFGVVILANTIAQYDMTPLYWYVVCVLIQIVAFYISDEKPVRTMILFSSLAVTAMLIGIFSTGIIAVYAFLSAGLCCSIMWPSIFALSIAGLGKYTSQGSAFLVMMILGGGIIPPIQGKLADFLQINNPGVEGYGIHASFWVAALCFAYLLFFSFRVKTILKRQGIDYDQQTGISH